MHVLDRFLATSSQHPNRIALQEGQRSVSYQDFHIRACQLKSLLQQKGIHAGDHIAILLPRGCDATIAIYATLFAGCCYVPLDIKNPISRLQFIIQDANITCIIGSGAKPDWCDSHDWIDISQIQDGDENDIDVICRGHDHDLATILYTSGSTGMPKGVAIPHKAITAFAQWSRQSFDISENDIIASLAPFHFDLSVFDLFTSLSSGAQTIFVPEGLTMFPSRLTRWLEEQGITTWYTVPSILSFITMKGELNHIQLPKLEKLLFAGEVFATPRLIELTALLPHVKMFNLFGPTETNVCTFWPVDRDRLSPDQAIPIGQAACLATLKIDESNHELLVKGPCVTAGYWKDGKLEPVTDKGWYRTGDKVSINQHNEYLYHGRLDRMIKSSGYRIEPAEIEQTMNTSPLIQTSAVTTVADPVSGRRIVAAIVASTDFDMSTFKQYLTAKLPTYMLPSQLKVIDTMPTLSNGKTDYQTLNMLF